MTTLATITPRRPIDCHCEPSTDGAAIAPSPIRPIAYCAQTFFINLLNYKNISIDWCSAIS